MTDGNKELHVIAIEKTILYVERSKCEETFNFYKDLGLEVLCAIPSFTWCELKTGSLSLCIHGEPPESHKFLALNRTGTRLVFATETKEELENIYQLFLKKLSLNNRKELGANDIAELDFAADKNLHYFWLGDPAGNVVQVEYKGEK